MFSFGQRAARTTSIPVFQLGLSLFLLTGAITSVSGQTAPYVLPYTIQTYAGANAQYTVGAPCGGTSSMVALDVLGDGCLATQASVSTDPHDVRVDPFGFVYYADNGNSVGLIHRINPYTGLFTSYFGNAVNNSKLCSGADATTGKSGVNCISTDGVANSGPYNLLVTSSGLANGPFYAVNTGALRGLGVDGAGNVYLANYGQDLVEEINEVGHKVNLLVGAYHTPGLVNGTTGAGTTTEVSAARGVGIDPTTGNVYIADTGNNILRLVSGGQVTNYTATNTAKTLSPSPITPVPYTSALLAAPEDVQVDLYGNIFIADSANNVIRAIYKAGYPTKFFGNANPQVNYVYTVAGSGVTPVAGTYTGYPTDGTTPVVANTAPTIGVRKIGLDPLGNLYIADTSFSVVWFVDHVTGGMRVIAGRFGIAASAAPAFICAQHTDAVGDNCPATQAGIFVGTTTADPATQPDRFGNLYISDSEGNVAAASRIRKVLSGLNFPLSPATPAGTSVAQTLEMHFAPSDGPAAATPYVITNSDYALTSSTCTTNAFDSTQDCLLTVTFTPSAAGYETGTLTVTSTAGATASFQLTGAGSAPILAFDPGNTSQLSSTVSNSQGIALDGAGNAYIADTGNNQILFYNAASAATSVLVPAAAGLKAPMAVAIGTDGNIYIADTGNNLIRKATPAGVLTTIGGGGTVCAAATDAFGDNCPATQATFSSPSGIATDYLGQVFVSDTGNNIIRQIGTSGYVQLLAGGATTFCPVSPYPSPTPTDSVGDGCAALQTSFSAPAGLAFDGSSSLYVADKGNSIVRKIGLSTSFTDSSNLASAIAVNPVTLVAGNLSAGATLDGSYVATNSQLNNPTGVAVSASGTVYIADTGNHAIRMVTNNTISTIAGILGTSGTGTLGSATANTQLSSPGSVAVTPFGTLFILDSGNNRVLTDNRSAVSYNFGYINVNSSSPTQNFTEINLGTSAAKLPAPLFTQAPANTQLTLAAKALNNNSIPACASGNIASAGICGLQAQFNPTAPGPNSSTFSQANGAAGTGVPTAAPAASITLSGTGLVLVPTTSTISQTVPATGSPVFGGPLTVSVSVTANSCSPVPLSSCNPAGTVTFTVDSQASAPVVITPGTPVSQSFPGLSVGPHTFSCNFTSTDGLYASSSCGNLIITVTAAPTKSVLTATNSNQPQFLNNSCITNSSSHITTCTVSTLSATVTSTTTGTPTGSVTFFVNGTSIGSASLNSSAVANFNLAYAYNADGTLASNNTLAPGTYSLTCTYNGSNNFAVSNCAAVPYTVLPQSQSLTLTARGCLATALIPNGTATASLGQNCPSAVFTNNVPTVATADGSTTDATIFITPNNTISGTFTFSCSGLPANTGCTFAPTSLTLTAGTTYATPVYFDVTFFTDVPASNLASAGGQRPTSTLAMIVGWPLTFFGLLAMPGLRRRKNLRGLSLLASVILLAGTALTFAGCAGPGNYAPVLTPAGTYPITITATNGTIKASTVVDLTVTAPGIAGQQ